MLVPIFTLGVQAAASHCWSRGRRCNEQPYLNATKYLCCYPDEVDAQNICAALTAYGAEVFYNLGTLTECNRHAIFDVRAIPVRSSDSISQMIRREERLN